MTVLSDQMRALAERLGESAAADLRAKADAFDDATTAHCTPGSAEDSAKTMLRAWAKARRAYCRTLSKIDGNTKLEGN